MGYGRKAMPYLFALQGGVGTQMIPAVTSQGNRPQNANKWHMGVYRNRWGINATPGGKTQRASERVGLSRNHREGGGKTQP